MHTPSRRACRGPQLSPLLAALAVAVFPAVSSAAGDSSEPVRLDYHASAECPDEDEFIARLRARTSHVRPAWPGEAARTFAVVADAGPPPSGQLRVGDSADPGGVRVVRADSCSQVVDALALMVALAVDPSPSFAAPASPVEAAPAPSTSVRPGAPAPAPAHAPGPAPAPAPAPASESASEGSSGSFPIGPSHGDLSPRERASAQERVATGLDVVLSSGVAPRALVAASPFVGYAFRRGGWIDPSFRLGFLRAWSGLFDVASGGRAALTWTVGRADACPIALPGSWLHVTGCVRVEAGLLEAQGADIASSQVTSRAWLAAGPLLRAEVSLFGPLFADAEGSALFRVTEDRFYFRPNSTIYRIPLTGFGGGAGLGVRFL